MKPQNLVVPHPKKKVEDMGNYRIHHVKDVLQDVELLQEDTNAPVQLKFGEGAMETYDEPLAVKASLNPAFDCFYCVWCLLLTLVRSFSRENTRNE